jgi:hypothetical protein
VVVPNGTLFGDGVCARIKEELLKEFNLHTIVRLPNGVFAPYTGIPTNILFFDRSGPTREVWYYEQPLPEGRKNYTKTAPHPVRGIRAAPGALIKTKKQQRCRMGEFLVAEIDAKVGGFGIVPPELDGSIVSSHYFLFVANEELLDRRFLGWFIKMPAFRKQIEAQGSTNYAAIRPAQVLGYEIPLPPLSEQRRIVARIEEVNDLKQLHAKSGDDLNALLGVMLYRSFKGAL